MRFGTAGDPVMLGWERQMMGLPHLLLTHAALKPPPPPPHHAMHPPQALQYFQTYVHSLSDSGSLFPAIMTPYTALWVLAGPR